MIMLLVSFLVLLCPFAGYAELRIVPDNYETIQAALDYSYDGDTILVRSGRYEEALVFPDASIVLAGAYLFIPDSSLIDSTVLVSDRDQLSITATAGPAAETLTIIGLRFKGTPNPVSFSGGMFVNGGNVRIQDCIFDSCYANMSGILDFRANNVIISESKFVNCITGQLGELIHVENANVFCDSCLFTDLSNGGPCFELEDGQITVSQSRFENVWGSLQTGSIAGFHGAPSLTIENSRITHCRFNSFHVWENSQASIRFSGNEMDSNIIVQEWISDGYLLEGASVVVEDNSFYDNEPQDLWVSPFFLTFTNQSNIQREIVGNLFLRNHLHEASCLNISTGLSLLCKRNYFIDNSNEAIVDPPGGAVRLANNGEGTFFENVFYGNAGQAIDHVSGTTGTARNCYWGDPSGPYHPQANPQGQGDTIDSGIQFEPWQPDTLFLSSEERPFASQPVDFALGYPYPNPFNAAVTIEYAVTREQEIKLVIFDTLGREIETLVHATHPLGIHRAHWNANGFPSGLYFARLASADASQSQTTKLILLK